MPDHELRAPPGFRTRPLYLQVYDHFVELIAAGEWACGQLIESEVDLAKRMNVSVGTVRKALDELESKGLVSRRQGRGTTVNDQSGDAFTIRFSNLRIGDGQRVTGTISQCTSEIAKATPEEQVHLTLLPADLIYRCIRVREFHGRKFMHERLCVPKNRLPDITPDEFRIARVVAIAAKRNRLILESGSERVNIAMASEEVAGSLGIAAGTPLLHLDRIVRSADGLPLEWRVADCILHEKYYMADF